MFRSQVEKISGVRKIAVLRANAPGDFIFVLSAVEDSTRHFYQVPELCSLRKKEVTLAALNLFFMKTSTSRLQQEKIDFFVSRVIVERRSCKVMYVFQHRSHK